MGRKLTPQEQAWRAVTERDYQKQIADLADMYGWTWVHFRDSRRQVGPHTFVGDEQAAGWPDLFLARPPELVAIEVKKELGKTTPAQEKWLEILGACGVDVFVSRPSTFNEVQRRLTRSRPRT